MLKIQEGLIFTNDNCVGCNKCIGVCSCNGATIATESSDGMNLIKVDGSKCVACGACLDACEHQAREFLDDTQSFFRDLEKGEDISILIAPAFFANYPEEQESILGKLKALGINRMLSVSFGADITTWAYLNYMSKSNAKGFISQPCPATVDYIEKYIPELIPKLMPVQSPVMCAAIYARKNMNLKGKMAFIGPCIAKKNEFMSKRGKEMVSYNVTFDHLLKYLRNKRIKPVPFKIETENGLGSVYPMPGGLAENLYWFLGEDAFIRQVTGEKKMYGYLEENKNRILEKDSAFDFVDVLNCSEGCLCGTGIEESNASKEDVFIQMKKIRDRSKNNDNLSWSSKLTPKERLESLNEQFKALNLEDYLCSYEDKSKECKFRQPTNKELESIFESMNKITAESRKINCSSCGYNSCREMATAIYNGYNHKENCIHFIKEVLEDISIECPTVLLIHEKNQSVHIVKYTGEDSIQSWIQSGLNSMDYNQAIKDYIDRYVDNMDKERIWNHVEFSSLMETLSNKNHYSITYMRHPENGKSGYFQLEFSKLSHRNDIVVTFHDVDEALREDLMIRDKLQEALDNVNSENEIVRSLACVYNNLYLIDLEKDSYKKIKATDEVAAFVSQFASASECLRALPDAMYEKEDMEMQRRFFNTDIWPELLKDKDFCNIDGRGRFNGWLRSNLICTERDRFGNAIKILCAIQNIHEEKERELKNFAIISGLSAEFTTLWLIDAKRRKIQLVREGKAATLEGLEDDKKIQWADYDFVMGNYIDNYVSESDRERVRNLVQFEHLLDTIPSDDEYTINFQKLLRDGTSRYTQMVFVRSRSIMKFENITLAFRDIDNLIHEEQEKENQLKEALLAAEQANITKSTFLANMSHEIRTPINAILGMDTMILRESNQENVLEYARNVKAASDTLLSLINDILDFSKIESGKMEIVEGNYRLDSVINDLMNMETKKAEEKGLNLKLKIQDDIPAELFGDEIRIKQIILNLINNAVKYTKEGTVTFDIGYEQIDETTINLLVKVSDTGIGIKKEDMQKLFSPYERLEENKNKYIEGTGLGLSITRNLLEKMNSALKVDSVYGKGSTFYFVLRQTVCGPDKIRNGQFSSKVFSAEEKKESFHAKDAEILVVDDVEMNIMVIKSLLKRISVSPDYCMSGAEALELAESKKYDIIFLDAMMPGLSGEETLVKMRELCEKNKETPIIVLTANAIVGAREKYIKEGFTDYLSKPVDGKKLEDIIQQYLPKEKIIEVAAGSDNSNALTAEEEKEQELLKRIQEIPVISVQDGISASGGSDTYLSLCKNFYDTSSMRIDMIKNYFDSLDIKNYTIQVHALKSSARLLGANELSNLAKDLEMAGHENDTGKIQEQTAKLLEDYKALAGYLGKIYQADSQEKEDTRKELPLKKFNRMLSEMMELVEAFDMQSAKELFEELGNYKVPAEGTDIVPKIQSNLADVNRDEILALIKNYLENN